MHPDNFTGMMYGNVQTPAIVFRKLMMDLILVAHKDYGNTEFPDGRNGPGNFHNGRVITAHSINSDSHGTPQLMNHDQIDISA
jgi:hypothetical protein